MGKTSRRKEGARPYRNYSEDYLKKILDDVRMKRVSAREAQKIYGVHRNVIASKLKLQDKSAFQTRNPGRPTVLSGQEEKVITAHVFALSTYGFPINKLELRVLVKNYLTRIGRVVSVFKDNMPGKAWVNLFLKRHQMLNMRMSQNISRYGAGFDIAAIDVFFENLETELEGIPPQNIWNFDEVNLTDDPGSTKIIGRRGYKYPELIENASKGATSIMMSGNAAGELSPIYVTYKAENVYPEWTEGGPPGTRYNYSKCGWFDVRIFEDWFQFTFLPTLMKHTGSKVIIGDNFSSHISHRVITLCEKNDVKFLALPPHSTHLLQPLEVGLYGPLKRAWRKALNEWRKTTHGRKLASLPKSEFPKLLKTSMEELEPKIKEIMQSGFKGTGIYPLNREHIFKKLCDSRLQNEQAQIRENVSEIFLSKLQASRQHITENLTRRRKSKSNVPSVRGLTLEDLEPTEHEQPRPSTSKQRGRGWAKQQVTNSERNSSLSERDVSYAEREESTSYIDSPHNNHASVTDFVDNPSVVVQPLKVISAVEPPTDAVREEQDGADDEQLADLSHSVDELAPVAAPLREVKDDPLATQKRDTINYVVVKYCGKLYPGLRLSVFDEKGEAPVSAMSKKGKFWTWPDPPDVVWYKARQIVRTMQPPREISPGVFLVDLKQ